MSKSRSILFLGSFVLITLACVMPFGQVQDVPKLNDYDLTATALFSSGIFGSLTPKPEGTLDGTTNLLLDDTSTPFPTLTGTDTPTLIPTPISSSTSPTGPTIIYVPANPTQSPIRPGGAVLANYFSQPPNMDGNWDDYTGQEYPIDAIVYGYSNWSSENDLVGAYRIGWDMSSLYLAVKVRDDVYAQKAAGSDLYKGDSIEVLIDGDLYGDFYSNTMNSDDYQLGISPGRPTVNDIKEAILWYPRAISGGRSFPVASMSSEGVYRVEMAIPWSIFSIIPYATNHYGFAVSISDNDDPLQNLQQTMASSIPGRKLTLPMTWGNSSYAS